MRNPFGLPSSVATAAILVTVAGSSLLGQQTKSWDNYCTVGSFQACMSLSLTISPFVTTTGARQSLVSIAIRNLEGTLGSAGAWGVRTISLTGLETDPATLPPIGGMVIETPSAVALFNNAVRVVAPGQSASALGGSLWDVKPEDSHGSGFITREPGSWGGPPIVGCTAPALGPNGYYWTNIAGFLQTCGDAAVVFSFTTNWQLEISDQTALSVTGIGPAGSGLSCRAEIDCFSADTPVSATPEPATIALVGSGLIGIAGVQLRRRRRFRI